jgi:hypothetical protein
MLRSPSHDGLGKGGHIALEIRCIGPNFPPSYGTPYPAFYYYYEKETITHGLIRSHGGGINHIYF